MQRTSDKRRRRVFWSLFIASFVLTFVRVVYLTTLTTRGTALGDIQSRTAQLRQENTNMKAEILRLSSLQRINSDARAQGYQDATYYVVRGGE